MCWRGASAPCTTLASICVRLSTWFEKRPAHRCGRPPVSLTAATAARITSVTICGCEIMITWEPSTSVILAQALPFLGSEGGDIDQADNVAGLGGGDGDHRTRVRVANGQDRAANLVEEAGEVGGVTGQAAQWIGRSSHLHPARLQPLNHAR